ncbi:ATP-binding protein [Streptomyces sp. NPDC098781]|uniref:ATP-binding protein n=1 Tax=Streptomyces sp. NPDC098781 TaxID=3366097 RepID=UPI003807A877
MSGERARLTMLYGGLLVLAGALLTGVVYFLVRQGLSETIGSAVTRAVPGWRPGEEKPSWATDPSAAPPPDASPPPTMWALQKSVSDAAEQAALHRLLTISLLVLALYSVLSVALAWWTAGRVLRPVAVITDTARRLSGENLSERIALAGPPGELKHLADTFDAMLERLEQAVTAQQRFAANAAHELRTPLALQRAAADIGLAGEPDAASVAHIRNELLAIADSSERTIEGLLLLAAPDQGLEHREPVEVHTLAWNAADDLAREAKQREVSVSVRGEPLTVQGDPVLLGRLLHNLLANGIRHNAHGGRVEVRTGPHGIEVTNTGPVIDPATVPLLFEPFRRLAQRRRTPGEGAGLGLSIVASIARVHGASATAKANPAPGGGLTVRVSF